MKTKATLPLILILLICGMGCHFMGMSSEPPPTNPLLGERWERTSVSDENNTKQTTTNTLFLSDGKFVEGTAVEIITDSIISMTIIGGISRPNFGEISSTMITHVHGNYTIDGGQLTLIAEIVNVEFLPVDFWEQTLGMTQPQYKDDLLESYPRQFPYQIQDETLILTTSDGKQVSFHIQQGKKQ